MKYIVVVHLLESLIDWIISLKWVRLVARCVHACVYIHDHVGYAAQDLYQINPHFGGNDGLMALIKACHAQGVWVMVDVVANHMGIPANYNFSILVSDSLPFSSLLLLHTPDQVY